MPLSKYVNNSERGWLFNVTLKNSERPYHDLCLLSFFLGTPLTILEINCIKVTEVCALKKLKLQKPDHRGFDRYCYLTSGLLRKHLTWQLETFSNEQITANEHLFQTEKGEPFRLTKVGDNYKAETLKKYIFKLLKEGGIENPGTETGRRTFAINIQKNLPGVSIKYIHHLLGNKKLSTTEKMLLKNPFDMGDIAAKAFK